MSTLSAVKKGLSAISAPQLVGADLGTRGGEFWNFNGPAGFDYKFSYTGHQSSLKAFKKCPPLNAVIMKKAQAFVNGKTWILNKKGKARDKEASGEVAERVRKLMSHPNPFQGRKEFEAQQYIYSQLFGFSILLPITPVGFDNTHAVRLWNIPPSMIDIEETKKNWLLAEKQSDVIKSIVINFDHERAYLPLDQIYIIKDFTPSFHSPVFPESRVSALEMPVNNIIGAYESRNVLINYRGALGIISSDGKDAGGFIPIKEEEKESLQSDFRRYGLTRSQWQFIITSASVKWTQMGVSTKDLMLFEEIDDDIQRICDGYNYPYRLLSSEKSNSLGGSDLQVWKSELYEGAIIPESESICEQWDEFFSLSKYDLIAIKDFTHVPALQGDEIKKAEARDRRNKAYQTEFFANLTTLNEWRIANGDDPLDGEIGTMRYSELAKAGWVFAGVINIENVIQSSQNKQQDQGQSNQEAQP